MPEKKSLQFHKLGRRKVLAAALSLCALARTEGKEQGLQARICPGNLSLEEDGSVRTLRDTLTQEASTEEMQFMAPEVFWKGETGPRADIYSIGMLLYYGVSRGKLPFAEETDADTANKRRLAGKHFSAPTQADDFLASIIEKATAFRPEDRYAGIYELEAMLKRCAEEKTAQELLGKEDKPLSPVEQLLQDIMLQNRKDGALPDETGEDEAADEAEVSEAAGEEEPAPTDTPEEEAAAAAEMTEEVSAAAETVEEETAVPMAEEAAPVTEAEETLAAEALTVKAVEKAEKDVRRAAKKAGRKAKKQAKKAATAAETTAEDADKISEPETAAHEEEMPAVTETVQAAPAAEAAPAAGEAEKENDVPAGGEKTTDAGREDAAGFVWKRFGTAQPGKRTEPFEDFEDKGELIPTETERTPDKGYAGGGVVYGKNLSRERDLAREVRQRRRRPLLIMALLLAILVLVALAVNSYEKANNLIYPAQTAAPAYITIETPKPERIATPEPTATPVPEPVVTEVPHSYEVFVEDVSWTEAKARCEEKGGRLVTINDEEEYQYIVAMVEGDSRITKVWVGCHRVDGKLVWENGIDISFYPWAQGEPSGYDYGDGVPEDYVMLWYHNNGWRYNDSRNDPVADYPHMYSGQIAYICEYGG